MSMTSILDQALDDAATLLGHAHRFGKDVVPADRDAILNYADKVAQKTPTTPAEQAELFRAQAALAKQLDPVTVDGIRSTDYRSLDNHHLIGRLISLVTFGRWPYQGTFPALAFRIVSRYSAGALLILILTVLVITSANDQITYFTMMRQAVDKNAAIQNSQKGIDENIKGKKDQLALINAKLDDANEKNDAAEVAKQTEAASQLSGAIHELNVQRGQLEYDAQDTVTSYNVAASRLQQGNWISRAIGTIKAALGLRLPPEAGVSSEPITFERQLGLLLTVKQALVWQLGFALPAFAALLGCMVASLRGMAREIADDTYTEASRIQYQVKLILAPLCGIIIGLVSVGDAVPIAGQSLARLAADAEATTITTSTITLQFTAAFVVGYALEVFFSIVDRFVDATKAKA